MKLFEQSVERYSRLRVVAWLGVAAITFLVSSCSVEVSSGSESIGDETETEQNDSENDENENEAGNEDEDGAAAGSAAEAPDLVDGDRVVPRIAIPLVPVIVLPDLSVLSENGQLVEDQLGDLVGPTAGLDVVAAVCAEADGELVYQGSAGMSFLDVGTDGSGLFADPVNEVVIALGSDGSGTYTDPERTIDVQSDGSGTYVNGVSGLVIGVESDGSGTYSDAATGVVVSIESDGSGTYADSEQTTSVESDGSGAYVNNTSGVVITGESDGSWSYADAATEVILMVESDGSGTYGDGERIIEVDSDGNGMYSDGTGTIAEFTAELGILDPSVLIAGPRPVFAVADRFPPLDGLGSLQPACATVFRLDADVLFDFDSDQLRPEADGVLDGLAEVLIEQGAALEVHGHTDSVGADDYNQDLSERRAVAVQTALVERGVTTEIASVGFGEIRPVAPNETSDGSDNPAGRQLNRRVEVVLAE